MAMLTRFRFRYCCGSSPAADRCGLVAAQTSTVPRVSSAATATVRNQSICHNADCGSTRRAATDWDRVVVRVDLEVTMPV